MCSICNEKYDLREDNIGLKKGVCYKCNIKNLRTPRNIIFFDTCKFCGNECSEGEKIRNDNICRKCTIDRLEDIGCETGKCSRCENDECKKCYFKSFSRHEKIKYWKIGKNNDISPRDISSYAHEKFWFVCDKCGHDFEMSPHRVNHNSWCPFCASKNLCNNLECKYCFNKSFASHEKAKYWDIEKNKISPRYVALNSHSKFWFTCDKCNHNFKLCLGDMNHGNNWCSFCVNQKRCDISDCKHCFNNSFASHEKAKYWNIEKNNDILPRAVALNSHSKFWFTCEKCQHDFKRCLADINHHDQWCSFCVNMERCDSLDCKHCFNNSFASHEKAKYWDIEKNNNVLSRNVALNSRDKFWFTCEECKNCFKTRPYTVNSGSWCPFCKHKTELKIFSFIKENKIEITRQFKCDWCRNPETNKYLPFDLCIEDKRIIIEIDGRQHFENVEYWRSSSEENTNRDVYKMNQALQKGYSIIRIYQPDVWRNSYDWKTNLLSVISKCEPNKVYYLSKDEKIYDNHQNKMI
jgi:very-short-patch-repair endonuclease